MNNTIKKLHKNKTLASVNLEDYCNKYFWKKKEPEFLYYESFGICSEQRPEPKENEVEHEDPMNAAKTAAKMQVQYWRQMMDRESLVAEATIQQLVDSGVCISKQLREKQPCQYARFYINI